eukprot:14747673-Heterocapsa_arctica.AAC.1
MARLGAEALPEGIARCPSLLAGWPAARRASKTLEPNDNRSFNSYIQVPNNQPLVQLNKGRQQNRQYRKPDMSLADSLPFLTWDKYMTMNHSCLNSTI